MTQLYMVRHGPTHAKTMVGWSDLPADLSDTEALHRLARYLPEQAIVISSDLSRAVTTADAIQGTRTRLPHQSGLREINFGAWELRSFRDIEAEDPDHIRAYSQTPGDVRPHGNGESWNELSHRLNHEVDRLITGYPGADIVLVAHFGVILTQIQRAEDIAAEAAFSHRIDNLSVTEVQRTKTGWQTGRINHLP